MKKQKFQDEKRSRIKKILAGRKIDEMKQQLNIVEESFLKLRTVSLDAIIETLKICFEAVLVYHDKNEELKKELKKFKESKKIKKFL